jgi:hypothetical protein
LQGQGVMPVGVGVFSFRQDSKIRKPSHV